MWCYSIIYLRIEDLSFTKKLFCELLQSLPRMHLSISITILYTSTYMLAICNLFNRLSYYYIHFVLRITCSRQFLKLWKPSLKYFRGSRVNFRNDDEHREFQGLSRYRHNNPQKSLELLTSLFRGVARKSWYTHATCKMYFTAYYLHNAQLRITDQYYIYIHRSGVYITYHFPLHSKRDVARWNIRYVYIELISTLK